MNTQAGLFDRSVGATQHASTAVDPNPLVELFRDPYLLAVHKPAGLLLHRSPIDRHETEFALQYARALNGGEHVYPVHRLDRPTSGLLLFARDPDTASVLGKAFMAGEVQKTYLALVRGWSAEAGLIDHPLREHAIDRRCKDDPQPMREARSRFRRLATTEIPVRLEGYPSSRYSLVELYPETGRKHQLRRHMQHIAHPIIGDTNYGRTRHNHYFAERFGYSRLMLAATGMSFAHPVTGEPMTLRAEPDASFTRVLSVFGENLPPLPGGAGQDSAGP
ncbi:tRNA pseudouridine synthase C [Halopseudomonas xinjiangensis]|uniref:tRNA pseudouridine synthase C n=1 Tax=Halopseudomonas xinjiangensis TaxID=487184 RepID=A0A1H1VIX3_9GAMM|nr:pseudouridine synthase [Halopseudomonas xinjiangensis]SDS84894.1 tRNA pseudouridine synthase C [Halopseudomonas xinjiangensis]